MDKMKMKMKMKPNQPVPPLFDNNNGQFKMDWMKRRPSISSSVEEVAEDWSGKGALVLGANSPTGLAIVKKLLSLKMKVVAIDGESKIFEELKKNKELHKGRFHFIKKHIQSDMDVSDVLETADEKCGGVHVLVNNIVQNLQKMTQTSLLEMNMVEFHESMKKSALQGMAFYSDVVKMAMERFYSLGHIINITSELANRPSKNSKYHALAAIEATSHRLQMHLRQELEYNNINIKVTNICHGEDTILSNCEDVAEAVDFSLNTSNHCQVRDIWLQQSDDRSS